MLSFVRLSAIALSTIHYSFGNKKPFKEQPDFISNLGFDYNYEPWGTVFSLYWNYISDRQDFQATGKIKTIEAASTLNLGIRQRITDNLGLYFDAFNLTNAKKVETEVETNGKSSRKEESFGQTYIIGIHWKF